MDGEKGSSEFNLQEFGNRIGNCRRESGLSQMQLASLINISNNHLSNIENGKSIPSLSTFIAICNALQISADYLIHGEKYPLDHRIAEKLSRKSIKQKDQILRIIDTFPDNNG